MGETTGKQMAWSIAAGVATAGACVHVAAAQLSIDLVSRYETGLFDRGATEIAAHDPITQRLFVTNGATGAIDVLCIADPARPVLACSIDLSRHGRGANSVAVHRGVLAAAVEAHRSTDDGSLLFFATDGRLIGTAPVGPMPDMVAFSPDGRWALVANEGEPDDAYDVDPEGSVSIVPVPVDVGQTRPVRLHARTATFCHFDGMALDESIRVFGPGASVAQDLEPEYIAVSPDGRRAFVTCQENNALAIVDIERGAVVRLVGLGFKDHAAAGNAIDASNRDGGIHIRNWPVFGMYQPDAIVAFEAEGAVYLVVANEGDPRKLDAFAEQTRIRDLTLDPEAFPDADRLQQDSHLGRLQSTTTAGDDDGDGDQDRIFVYGGRSIAILDDAGRLVWDSGDQLERITARLLPEQFNSNNVENGSFDGRSDDRGPEPEGLAVAILVERTYAFVGLERIGGFVVYDISDPRAPTLVRYVNTRDFSDGVSIDGAGDLGPEGLVFIPADDSPTGTALLVVCYETSGTVAIYAIGTEDAGPTVAGPTAVNPTVAGDGADRYEPARPPADGSAVTSP